MCLGWDWDIGESDAENQSIVFGDTKTRVSCIDSKLPAVTSERSREVRLFGHYFTPSPEQGPSFAILINKD